MGVRHLLCSGEGEVREEGRTRELQEPVQIGHNVSPAQIDPGEVMTIYAHLSPYYTCYHITIHIIVCM